MGLDDLLRKNLKSMEPEGDKKLRYEKLRNMLSKNKPTREPPIIKESPENSRRDGTDS
jgi:hypothetical protein